MSLIEFIGFIVSIFAFFILSMRRMKEKQRAAQMDPHEEEEDDEALRDYLRSVGIEVEERPKAPPLIKAQPQARLPAPHEYAHSSGEYVPASHDYVPATPTKSITPKYYEDKKFVPTKTIDEKGYIGALAHAPAYEVHNNQTATSEVDMMLNNLPSMQNLVIASIIIGPPKAYE